MGRTGLPAGPLRRSEFENAFDYVLSFGARDENGGSDYQVHAPEFLMAGDVLRGDTAAPLGESPVIACSFVGSELVLRVGVEIGAVATQCEHQKQLGIQTRGGNLGSREAGDGVD